MKSHRPLSCRPSGFRIVPFGLLCIFLVGLPTTLSGSAVQSTSDGAGVRLSGVDVQADLGRLRSVLDESSSYATVNGYDYGAHIDSLGRTFSMGAGPNEFLFAVRQLVGRLQDAHSDVDPPEHWSESDDLRELPFPVADIDGGVVAFARNRPGLLVEGFPELTAIEGFPLDRVLEVAGVRYRGHSPQRFRSRAIEGLEEIEFVLGNLDVELGDRIHLTLTDGTRDTTVAIPLGSSQGSLPEKLDFGAEMIIGRYAHLRIPDMVSEYESGEDFGFRVVRAAMESADFESSAGMILDVRGNGGGSRQILELLLPYFIDAPTVYNAARPVGDTIGLRERGLVQPEDSTLSPEMRASAASFLSRFSPKWSPPEDRFLPDWYVAIVTDSPTPYEYSGPVAVLMDAGSFSATDVFLAAFGELPNVRLIGTASAGGSGRSRSFELPRSGIEVTLSTMASFQPDGSLFDGVGVTPDQVVPKTLMDYEGRTDTQLNAAIRWLLGR